MIGALILQIVLIALNAMFASAEIAVISVNETRLKMLADDGNAAAKKLYALKEQPSKFLSTIQVAITLAGFLGSAYAADNFADPLVALVIASGVTIPENVLNSVALVLITLILSYFSIVFGELVPKRVAMKNPDSLSLKLAGILYGVSKIFAPIVGLLTVSTNGVLRLLGVDPNEEEEPVTEEEIRMLLMEGNKKGVIPQEENEIIQNVFEIDDMTVEQICTHRREVVTLSTSDTIGEWDEIIHENRHTYYPVCGEEQEDIIGVLDTKDYFRMNERTIDSVLQEAVDKAFFVPETMRANVLLQNMRQTRRYFSVIIDEYGGFSGIVTLHDIVEALVGDLDEIDAPEKPKDIEQIDETTWRIQGCADLDKTAQALDVELPLEDCDTFSGYVCKVIGRIPEDGETFTCEADGLRIEVLSVENHIVTENIVHVLPPQEESTETAE